MLAHESCAFADLRNGRVGERIEKVVLSQEKFPADAFWVDIFIRLEWLLEAPLRRRGEVSTRKSELWLLGSFGRMISLCRIMLREGTQSLRRPQLGA